MAIRADNSTPVKYPAFLQENQLQTSVDIGLTRPIEIQRPLAVQVISNYGGQCLAFVQKIKGYKTEEFSGYPNRIVPNSDVPKIGYAVLTKEGKVGHVALISDIQGNELILLESNYHGDRLIDRSRRLDIDDNLIRGYYNFDINEGREVLADEVY